MLFFCIFNPCVLAVTILWLELLFERNGLLLFLVGVDLDKIALL